MVIEKPTIWAVEIKDGNSWIDINEEIKDSDLYKVKCLDFFTDFSFKASDSLINKLKDKKGKTIKLFRLIFDNGDPKKEEQYFIHSWGIKEKERKVVAYDPRNNVFYREEKIEE